MIPSLKETGHSSSSWFSRRASGSTCDSGSTIVASGSNPSAGKEAKLLDAGSKGDNLAVPQGGQHGMLEDQGLGLRLTHADGVSTFKTIANLVCVVGGTGTLGMPRAVAQSGWLGTSAILLALFMSAFTGQILIESLYLKTTKRRPSYQDIARDTYGNMGHRFTYGIVAVNLFGCAVLYIILSATLIEAMVRDYTSASEPIHFYVIGCSLFVWTCLIFTKTMKEVALLSVLGSFATFAVVCIAIGVSAEMALQLAARAPVMHKLVDWTKLPLSFATISFAYGGNVVYPHIEQSMRYPRSWAKALWVALSICCVMYFAIAIAGYAAFGDDAKSPVLRNLPRGALSVMANSFITLHVLLASPILLTSLAMMLEESILLRLPHFATGSIRFQFLKRAIPRTIIMFLVGLVSSVVPFFGDVMDLLGAMTTCLLVFVMPIMCYYRLGGLANAGWGFRLWAVFILVVGLISMVFGTYDAVKHLIDDFQRR
ncbi:hypothetical protein BGZ67_004918 [Mortierella alpina]|nr:hypothetical protein BGZ67_004918 [Mortierella alpina]